MPKNPHSFNPTLVRLALGQRIGQLGDLRLFQSHLGSISTEMMRTTVTMMIAFQSHLGSISTSR